MCKTVHCAVSKATHLKPEEFVWFKVTVMLFGILLGASHAEKLKKIMGVVWVLFLIFGGLLLLSLLPKKDQNAGV